MTDELPLIVRIGRATFYGDGDPLAIGYHIAADGLAGWSDGVEPRLNETAKAQSHGSFDVPVFLGSRVVTLEGWIIARSEREISWWRGQLTGLLAERSEKLTVTQFGKTEWSKGRLGAKPAFEPYGGQAFADFSLQIWCPNPRIFGEVNTPPAGTSVISAHYGNVAATSKIVVSGAMSGYSIYGPAGKIYTVTAAVTAGHDHTIDMATGLVMQDGAYLVGKVSRGDTWAAPAGYAVTQTLVPLTGTGAMLIYTPDTRI